MSPPLEHDYIGLSDAAAGVVAHHLPAAQLNLKATELRLGPPGSASPDRNEVTPAFTLDLLPKASSNIVSGAKRGFFEAAIDGSAKWASGSASESSAKSSAPEGNGKEEADGMEDRKAPAPPAAKAQVVGWPPIRSYRKNTMASNNSKNKEEEDTKQGVGCLYVKVSMDGAPYLRKVDLKTYSNYKELSIALEKMFSGFTSGKDGNSDGRKTDPLAASEYVLTYEDKDSDWMLVGDVPWEMFIDSCRRMRIMKGSEAIGLAPRAGEKCKNRC